MNCDDDGGEIVCLVMVAIIVLFGLIIAVVLLYNYISVMASYHSTVIWNKQTIDKVRIMEYTESTYDGPATANEDKENHFSSKMSGNSHEKMVPYGPGLPQASESPVQLSDSGSQCYVVSSSPSAPAPEEVALVQQEFAHDDYTSGYQAMSK